MNLQATSDRPFGGGRPPIAGEHWWPASSVFRAEFLFSLGRDVAVTIRDSVLRGVSRFGDSRIRVSPMSLEWLLAHEAEYSKHPAEL
jgi:hypothetical protein